MASSYNSPTEYIEHHLKNMSVNIDGMSIHVDTVVNSFILGLITFGILWLVARRVTSGVPGRLQAAVELLLEFIDNQVKEIYHGSSKLVTPLAITVFMWVLVMNSVKLIPIDYIATITGFMGLATWRPVPTTDLNTTLALSLSVILLVMIFSVRAKGLGGYIHELFCTPFGGNPILWPFNFAFQLIELVSKPLSLALRLYGNMFAGEVIFLLIGMLGAVGIGGAIVAGLLHAGWAIFHILVVALQAFIFMMLTVVYLSMAEEHH